MSRYPVFYLTQSELGNICREKNVLFFPKFVTAMYLLFKGGPPAYTEVGEKKKFQKKQRCSKSDLKLFFERFEK